MFDSVWNGEDQFSSLQMLQPRVLSCDAVRNNFQNRNLCLQSLHRICYDYESPNQSFLKKEGTRKRPYNTYMSDVGFTFLPYLYKLTKFDHQNKWSFGNFFENAKFFAIKLNWPIEENFFHYSSNRVGEIQVVSTFYCKSWGEQHSPWLYSYNSAVATSNSTRTKYS